MCKEGKWIPKKDKGSLKKINANQKIPYDRKSIDSFKKYLKIKGFLKKINIIQRFP